MADLGYNSGHRLSVRLHPADNVVTARIDLLAARQEIISRSLPTVVRPIAFSEDNSALLFTTVNAGGTWKLRLADQAISKVADGVYLGRMIDS